MVISSFGCNLEICYRDTFPRRSFCWCWLIRSPWTFKVIVISPLASVKSAGRISFVFLVLSSIALYVAMTLPWKVFLALQLVNSSILIGVDVVGFCLQIWRKCVRESVFEREFLKIEISNVYLLGSVCNAFFSASRSNCLFMVLWADWVD